MKKNFFPKTLGELANLLSLPISGDKNLIIEGLCSLDKPKQGHIAFLRNDKGLDHALELLENSYLGAIVFPDSVPRNKFPAIYSPRPEHDFNFLAQQIPNFPCNSSPGIHSTAHVDSSAVIGENVYIGPNAVISAGAIIGDGTKIFPLVFVGEYTNIGKNCVLLPNVTIMHGCTIGDNAYLKPGAVIGADGFGLLYTDKGLVKIPQLGNVKLGKNTEVGCSSNIDRGRLDETSIGDYVKIDSQVHIAHNVQVGDYSCIVAQAGLEGRAVIGSKVLLMGKSGVRGGKKISDGVTVGSCAIAVDDLKEPTTYLGFPAVKKLKFLKFELAKERLLKLLDKNRQSNKK